MVLQTTSRPKTAFPASAIRATLREALSGLCDDVSAIREPWEPELDSLAVVDILVAVERVLPGFRFAPEKAVRKGGYRTVDEATKDIAARLQREWEQRG